MNKVKKIDDNAALMRGKIIGSTIKVEYKILEEKEERNRSGIKNK
jgi:hypothetical protein